MYSGINEKVYTLPLYTLSHSPSISIFRSLYISFSLFIFRSLYISIHLYSFSDLSISQSFYSFSDLSIPQSLYSFSDLSISQSLYSSLSFFLIFPFSSLFICFFFVFSLTLYTPPSFFLSHRSYSSFFIHFSIICLLQFCFHCICFSSSIFFHFTHSGKLYQVLVQFSKSFC